MSGRMYSAFLGFLVASILFVTTSVLIAWVGPTMTPPGGNVSAPINASTTSQIKAGSLGVGGLAVYGNAIISTVSGYLNFGSVTGSSGYGFRDNAGVIEVKNANGTWSPIATTTVVTTVNLYNNVHTSAQCAAAGGTLRSMGASGYLCERSGTSCWSGWTRLNNWGSTNPRTCTGGTRIGGAQCPSCTTGSHAFQNSGTETCMYSTGGDYTCIVGATCTASLVTVGCY